MILKYFKIMKNLDYLIQKYNKPIPRYTSFPPVPYWHDVPSSKTWLESVFSGYMSDDGIDIYVHVPFCEKLCYYCGCNRVITRNHDHEEVFITYLLKEWEIYLQSFKALYPESECKINSIHFGGGTPNFLSAENLKKVISTICQFRTNSFFGSIEVDPRTVSFEQLDVLLSLEVKRFSFGIQDFDLDVQQAINRLQSKEMIAQIVQYLRSHNVESINFDLIYGLPKQSIATVSDTFSKVVDLNPDMIAFYSYAHLPEKLKNQNLIKTEDLPSPTLKRELYLTGKKLLEENGYLEIGMDHFAKKDNYLVKCLEDKKLRRSFMGYTDKRSNTLIALGPTAISESDFGFFQNEKNLKEYMEKLNRGELPGANGSTHSEMDKAIATLIQEIMCQFILRKDLVAKLGERFPIDLAEFVEDGLIAEEGDCFLVTDLGRAFVRNLANHFDFYDATKSSKVKFSQSI